MPLYACAAMVKTPGFTDWTVGSAIANSAEEAEAVFGAEVRKIGPDYEIEGVKAYAVPQDMIRQVAEAEGL